MLMRLSLGVMVLLAGIMPQAALADSANVTFKAWHGGNLLVGQFEHTRVTLADGRMAVTLAPGAQTGTWTSPAYRSPAPIGDVVASWQAATPADSWIETRLSVQVAGHWSQWYVMAKWVSENTGMQRTSVDGQADADGSISTDTYLPGSNGLPVAYRLQAVLHGTAGARPLVYQLAATTSDGQVAADTSPTTMTRTIDLPVSQYSQEIHAGEYPAYDGGGEAWCSPTSTAMVMDYWHKGPNATDLATLVDPVFGAHGRVDGQVDWAALRTWDAAYVGTGNWPFNTAYASANDLDGSVRQYSSLADVERWIKRGVPVVTSIAWNNTDADPSNDLSGSFIAKSRGHLMVVRGFTAQGDVIVNDPAAPNDAAVRHIYARAQFEHNWQTFGSGATYVIKPLD